jgi:hypothetical protein
VPFWPRSALSTRAPAGALASIWPSRPRGEPLSARGRAPPPAPGLSRGAGMPRPSVRLNEQERAPTRRGGARLAAHRVGGCRSKDHAMDAVDRGDRRLAAAPVFASSAPSATGTIQAQVGRGAVERATVTVLPSRCRITFTTSQARGSGLGGPSRPDGSAPSSPHPAWKRRRRRGCEIRSAPAASPRAHARIARPTCSPSVTPRPRRPPAGGRLS